MYIVAQYPTSLHKNPLCRYFDGGYVAMHIEWSFLFLFATCLKSILPEGAKKPFQYHQKHCVLHHCGLI